MDDNLLEGNLHTGVVKADLHFAVHNADGGENIGLRYLSANAEIDGTAIQSLYAQISNGGLKDFGVMLGNLGQDLCQNGFHRLQIGGIGNGNIADRAAAGFGAIEHIADIGVVDNFHIAAGVFDAGCANADAFHGTAETGILNDVAHVEFIFKNQKNSGDDIGNQTLSSKADDQSYSPYHRPVEMCWILCFSPC